MLTIWAKMITCRKNCFEQLIIELHRITSGTKKEPKPKLLSPDIFWWGGGLPREGVGAKKFGMSLETQGIKLFWRDIPGFCRDIPEAPEKFEKKKFGFNFWPLLLYIRFCLPGFISGCNVMVSLSCAPAYREKGNHKGICLHYITRRGAPSELINFPDYITCILKAHRNLECNDFVPNGRSPMVPTLRLLPSSHIQDGEGSGITPLSKKSLRKTIKS